MEHANELGAELVKKPTFSEPLESLRSAQREKKTVVSRFFRFLHSSLAIVYLQPSSST